MALEARARLGPYELQAPLEAGEKGRGLSRHGHAPNRTVATKVLPSTFQGIWPGAKRSGNRSFADHNT